MKTIFLMIAMIVSFSALGNVDISECPNGDVYNFFSGQYTDFFAEEIERTNWDCSQSLKGEELQRAINSITSQLKTCSFNSGANYNYASNEEIFMLLENNEYRICQPNGRMPSHPSPWGFFDLFIWVTPTDSSSFAEPMIFTAEVFE